MKKNILLLCLLMPLFAISQESFKHRVTSTDGSVYIGDISSYIQRKIYFTDNVPGLNEKWMSVDLISKIEGIVPEQQMNWILEDNPKVVFSNVSPPSESVTINKKVERTAGDFLIQSGRLRLSGMIVGFGTGALFGAGAFDKLKLETQLKIAFGAGLVMLALEISSEIFKIKAGKQMNRDAVTISAAENGIGLAINF